MLIPGLVTRLLQPYVPFGTAPIDPLTLTGNEVYLLSTTPALSEGVALAAWADLSGNGRNASQAAAGQRPVGRTVTNLSPNGTQLVEFNAHGKEMTGALPAIPLDNSLGFTWYTAFRCITAETTEAFFGQFLFGCLFADYTELFARGSAGFGYSDNSSHGFGSNQAGGLHYSTGETLSTGWQTLVLRQSPPVGAAGSAELFKNGVLVGAAKPWKTSPVTGYAVGGTSGNAGALSGIGLALLRSGADTAATIAGILAYSASVFE